MESTGSKTLQRWGSGVKAEPKKMHAKRGASRHAEHMQSKGTHARRGERKRREKKKEGKEKTERAWISRRPCQG